MTKKFQADPKPVHLDVDADAYALLEEGLAQTKSLLRAQGKRVSQKTLSRRAYLSELIRKAFRKKHQGDRAAMRSAKANSLTIQKVGKTPRSKKEVDRLRQKLSIIAEVTTGDVTTLTTLMWNTLIRYCEEGMLPIAAMDQVSQEFKERYCLGVESLLKLHTNPRRSSSQNSISPDQRQ